MMVIFAVGAAAYFVWMKKKTGAMLAQTGDAYRMFFERTGYRFPELGGAPLEAHAQLGEKKTRDMMSGSGKAIEQHYVRDFHGLPVEFVQYYGAGEKENSYVMSAHWTAKTQHHSRVLWECAEKSLVGVRKAVGEMFTSGSRSYQPSYPHEFKSGDPQLDARFFFYAQDPNAAQAIVQNPHLKQLLLASTEVCLVVRPHEIFFSDPMQKNLHAGAGGTIGRMATGFDMMKSLELAIPVHDRMAELLAVTARASA